MPVCKCLLDVTHKCFCMCGQIPGTFRLMFADLKMQRSSMGVGEIHKKGQGVC